MTNIDDRQKALENKYAHDQELLFKIEARGCKLFGLWIASEMGLNEADAKVFAGSVVSSNLEEAGFGDVLRTVKAALAEKNIDISDHILETKLDQSLEQARQQVEDEKSA